MCKNQELHLALAKGFVPYAPVSSFFTLIVLIWFLMAMFQGQFMAMDSMWITATCVLAVFKIGRAVGPDGKEIIPSGEFQPGLVV